MESYVQGSYGSLEEAIQAYDTMAMKGYPEKGYHLVANKEVQSTFPGDTDLAIRTDLPHSSEITEEHQKELNQGNILLVITEPKD